jgi:hypothetical protein
MEDAEVAELHVFPDEVDVELNVFGAFVVHRIGGHVHRGHVVAVGYRGLGEGALEFAEELPEPDALCGGIRRGSILSFGA